MVTDAAGLAMYPLGKPTRNDPAVSYDWSPDNAWEVASGLFRKVADAGELAKLTGAAPEVVNNSLQDWNAACLEQMDGRFGRPGSSLHALQAPYFAAPVEPVVSNTQGGPVHDAEQRILTPYGDAIPGLFGAGECGSAFGHLYMSGGNLAECCIGGSIAGANAANGRNGS